MRVQFPLFSVHSQLFFHFRDFQGEHSAPVEGCCQIQVHFDYTKQNNKHYDKWGNAEHQLGSHHWRGIVVIYLCSVEQRDDWFISWWEEASSEKPAASFTFVGTLSRTRYNTIGTFDIQEYMPRGNIPGPTSTGKKRHSRFRKQNFTTTYHFWVNNYLLYWLAPLAGVAVTFLFVYNNRSQQPVEEIPFLVLLHASSQLSARRQHRNCIRQTGSKRKADENCPWQNS